MKWLKITAATNHAASEVTADIFAEYAKGAEIDDPALLNRYIDSGLWDYTDLKKAENTETVLISAYIPKDENADDIITSINERLQYTREVFPEGEISPLAMAELDDEDWSQTWKKYFHPQKVGDKIVIKPTWESYSPKEGETVIEIDPGAAFGTGAHPTTAMCLRELQTLGQKDAKVFDVGTGSGILSIAAAKLFAKKVLARDNDPTAVKVAAENLRQNKVEGKVTLEVGNLLTGVEGKADLIIANIIADIVILLMPQVKEHLNAEGNFLAGGIIAERLEDVKAAAKKNGFALIKICEEKGWATIVARHGKE